MCEFNIQEIELFNYRQFEDKKFVLNSRMNVFAGKNGSGKTTVLEAANVCLLYTSHVLPECREKTCPGTEKTFQM